MLFYLRNERAEVIVGPAHQTIVDHRDIRVGGFRQTVLQIEDVNFLNRRADSEGCFLRFFALRRQVIIEGLEIRIRENADGVILHGVLDAIRVEEAFHRVGMLLLAGGDILEDGKSPNIVESQINIAGEFLFFTHEEEAFDFRVGQVAGGSNLLGHVAHVIGASAAGIRCAVSIASIFLRKRGRNRLDTGSRRGLRRRRAGRKGKCAHHENAENDRKGLFHGVVSFWFLSKPVVFCQSPQIAAKSRTFRGGVTSRRIPERCKSFLWKI